jgi:integrase
LTRKAIDRAGDILGSALDSRRVLVVGDTPNDIAAAHTAGAIGIGVASGHAVASLRPGTLESYAYVLDKWIVRLLGPLRLRDLTRESIDQFRAQLAAAGAGAPTINRCLGILQGVLQRAVEWRRLPANPVAGVPRVGHVRDIGIDARTPEVVEAIRAKLARADAALVSVLAYEGLRPAEAFALEWRDVLDLAGRPRDRLQVRRSVSGDDVGTPKSKRAREPELFTPVARELAELYLACGRPPVRSLVFPAAKGGRLRRHNWRARVWVPALAAAFPCETCRGLGKAGPRRRCEPCRGRGTTAYFRPYDLRHTTATLLIYEGRTVNEVAEHLGHADPGFLARTYAHTFKAAARDRRRIPIEEAILAARRSASAVGS